MGFLPPKTAASAEFCLGKPGMLQSMGSGRHVLVTERQQSQWEVLFPVPSILYSLKTFHIKPPFPWSAVMEVW